jgi:sugar phosphate isomerase/epimerase
VSPWEIDTGHEGYTRREKALLILTEVIFHLAVKYNRQDAKERQESPRRGEHFSSEDQ